MMEKYTEFTSEDELHITSFHSNKIKDVASMIVGQFNLIGMYDVKIVPSTEKDTVQMDKRNQADTYITKWWVPKTTIEQGIAKVFEAMKNEKV
jgi:nucleoside-diphosphate-sugar epimerase